MRYHKTLSICALLFSALLPAAAHATTYRQVTGTLRYRDGGSMDNRTIQFVAVTVIPKKFPLMAKTVLTGWSGKYSAMLPDWAVPAGSQVEIRFISRNYAADVYVDLEWAEEWLTWNRVVTVSGTSGAIQLSATVAVANLSAHFNILEALRAGWLYASYHRGDDDDIAKVDVEYPENEWSHYSRKDADDRPSQIRLSGPQMFGHGGATDNNGNPADHGFRDEVILHEYGHHLTYEISKHDGSGGAHKETDDKGFEFGWAEGFPTYFAHAVAAWAPNRVTMNRSLEMMPAVDGPGAEAVVWAVLWDIHDGKTTGADRIAGTYALRKVVFAIFDWEIDRAETLSGKSIERSLRGFHDAWVRRSPYPEAHADLDRLLFAAGVDLHGKQDYRVTHVQALTSTVEVDQQFFVRCDVARKRFLYSGLPIHLKVQARRYVLSNGSLVATSEVYTLAYSNVSFAWNELTKTRWVLCKFPTAAPAGKWRVRVKIDWDNRVPEAREWNNLRYDTKLIELETLFNNPNYNPWATGSGRSQDSGDGPTSADIK